jgi:hypothetical protein
MIYTRADKYYGTEWMGWKHPIQDVSAQYEQYLKEGYNDKYWEGAKGIVNNHSPHVSFSTEVFIERSNFLKIIIL